LAFFRRDVAIARSYRVAFALEILEAFFGVATFYYLSRFVSNSELARTLPPSSDYFAFALVGFAFFDYLIWSDPVNGCESVGCFFLLFEDSASSSRGRCERRLISLIFAGRNRIILIRRELPLTYVASPAEPVAKVRRGFSFVPAPAAAGPVLE
jgi:hypothetical protein